MSSILLKDEYQGHVAGDVVSVPFAIGRELVQKGCGLYASEVRQKVRFVKDHGKHRAGDVHEVSIIEARELHSRKIAHEHREPPPEPEKKIERKRVEPKPEPKVEMPKPEAVLPPLPGIPTK